MDHQPPFGDALRDGGELHFLERAPAPAVVNVRRARRQLALHGAQQPLDPRQPRLGPPFAREQIGIVFGLAPPELGQLLST